MQPLQFMAAFAGGVLLGAAFFAGLWWTVRHVTHSKRPLLLYFASLALRMGLVLAGFYVLLERSTWLHMVVALAGFVGIRLVLMRLLASAPPGDSLGAGPAAVTDRSFEATSDGARKEF